MFGHLNGFFGFKENGIQQALRTSHGVLKPLLPLRGQTIILT